MSSPAPEAAPASTSAPDHRYRSVKWFHAVNTQQRLLAATQEITRLFYGGDDGEGQSRRGSLDRGASALPSSSSRRSSCGSRTDYAPPYRVFGLEADVQWHPSLQTSVMRHDPIPENTSAFIAAGSPSSPRGGEDDLFTLEVFLYSVAQALQGWKTRAASAAATGAAPPGPLHVIVKLDFKAFKAAQQFLSHAESRTWAGLEVLCSAAASSTSTTSSSSSRTRRRPSFRSLAGPLGERRSPTTMTAPQPAPTSSPPPPPVHVELWWNGDVVAQPAAQPHRLSFAAATVSEVVTVMARTAQALGARIPFGFSLGWVLARGGSASGGAAAPFYAAYREAEDVPRMTAFLDELAAALAPTPSCAVTTTAAPAAAAATNAKATTVHATPPQLTAAHLPAVGVHLITFPMLFEAVFADVCPAAEKHEGEEDDKMKAVRAVASAQTTAAARRHGQSTPATSGVTAASLLTKHESAAESRRVAAAVVAHAVALFFPSPSSTSSAVFSTSQHSSAALFMDDSREVLASVRPSEPESRCFPTFWKAVRASPPPSAAEGWQPAEDLVAQSFFPYCTIDG